MPTWKRAKEIGKSRGDSKEKLKILKYPFRRERGERGREESVECVYRLCIQVFYAHILVSCVLSSIISLILFDL